MHRVAVVADGFGEKDFYGRYVFERNFKTSFPARRIGRQRRRQWVNRQF